MPKKDSLKMMNLLSDLFDDEIKEKDETGDKNKDEKEIGK
jgi:hypothetical protein